MPSYKKPTLVDFLSKHRVKNTGEVPQYYVEDHHEAIIPKNIFYGCTGRNAAEGKAENEVKTA